MKKLGLILICSIAIISSIIFLNKHPLNAKTPDAEPVDTVFIGDKKYLSTFDQSVKSAKIFDGLYEQGVLAKRDGKYNEAINVLNQGLPHASMGPEVAMIYEELAEIYRAQGDLNKELFYLEQIPKYTMSDRIKKECNLRAVEIRQLLADKSQATQT